MNIPFKAIVGLGNPGPSYIYTRHNIGFRIVDALAQAHGASWRTTAAMATAEIDIEGNTLILIKSLTGMNCSGDVVKILKKKGITPLQTIIVHDELEQPFGKISFKSGGSAKGHNGLRSFIAAWGPDFWRMRFGIGRPENKEDVSRYVLSNFTEGDSRLTALINEAVAQLQQKIRE